MNRGVGVVRDSRVRGTSGGCESLTHTRWIGGMRYLRRGKWIRDEMFVSGKKMRVN